MGGELTVCVTGWLAGWLGLAPPPYPTPPTPPAGWLAVVRGCFMFRFLLASYFRFWVGGLDAIQHKIL